MSAKIIPLYPEHFSEQASYPVAETLVSGAWNFARSALWPTRHFTRPEEDEVKKYIRDYLSAATKKRRAFTALCQRVMLTQKYIAAAPNRYVPDPAVWFNRSYPFGFAGTLLWFRNVERRRKEVPGYLAHFETLANGYYEYVFKPSPQVFGKCRNALLKREAHSLLQLFYNSVAQASYNRA